MADLDRRLRGLKHISVPSAPPVASLAARNRGRRGRRLAVGAATTLLVVTALMVVRPGDGAVDDVTVVAPAEEETTSVPESTSVPEDVVLGPVDRSRFGSPGEVEALDGLEPCSGPPGLFAADLDPDDSLGVAGGAGTLVDVEPTAVLDRVPVDVGAARAASCTSAGEIREAGLVAIRLEGAGGEVLYEAASVPNGRDTVPVHFAEAMPGAEYQQDVLGSGHYVVGYVQASGGGSGEAPTRILGVVEERRFAARGPASPSGEPAGVLGQLVEIPEALSSNVAQGGGADDEVLSLTPGVLPEDASLCLHARYPLVSVRWCSRAGDVEVRSGDTLQSVDGEAETLNGRDATVGRDGGAWVVGVQDVSEAPVHARIGGGASREDALRIAESIPRLADRLEGPRVGDGDLRGSLSAEWVQERALLAGAASAVPEASDDQVMHVVSDSAGASFRLIAAADAPVRTPPFASEVRPLSDRVDLILTLPETSQAVGTFGCGRISWQLVGADQQPRAFIEQFAQQLVDQLAC